MAATVILQRLDCFGKANKRSTLPPTTSFVGPCVHKDCYPACSPILYISSLFGRTSPPPAVSILPHCKYPYPTHPPSMQNCILLHIFLSHAPFRALSNAHFFSPVPFCPDKQASTQLHNNHYATITPRTIQSHSTWQLTAIVLFSFFSRFLLSFFLFSLQHSSFIWATLDHPHCNP